MRLGHVSWFGLYVLVACSSQSNGDGVVRRSPSESSHAGATTDGGAETCPETDAGPPDSGPPDAGPPVRLTPSNLPADICDTPGTKDLLPGDPLGTCDVIVQQGNGLPEICVYKFGTVNITSKIGFPDSRAVAIVATNTLTIASGGGIDVSARYPALSGCGGPDPRGAGGILGGAGHVTRGGSQWGGSAYAPSGPQLTAGAQGGKGSSTPNRQPVNGGGGGGAIQLVSCGRLDIHGSIESNGENGMSTPQSGTGGGGGGSAGTILLEGAQIFMAGATLRAVGGDGGNGADGFGGSDLGLGGKGGTGASPPGSGGGGGPRYGPGGGGGSVGRILINVPQGAPQPVVSSDPPPVFGIVATH